MGVEHALLPEKGLVAPGELIIGADSHTCTYGALGAFSTGVGSTDMAAGMATGKAWFKVPAAIKFNLKGKLSPWCQRQGRHPAHHRHDRRGRRAVQVDGIRRRGRHTTCPWTTASPSANMAIEAGAQERHLPGGRQDHGLCQGPRKPRVYGITRLTRTRSMSRAIEIDLSALKPTVAFPHLPENTKTIDERGRYEDRPGRSSAPAPTAASTICALRPRSSRAARWQSDVRAIIIPATQEIYLQCIEEGSDEDLHRGWLRSFPRRPAARASAAIWVSWRTASGPFPPPTATLSAVWAISTSEVYLASPAVAAASAVAGYICRTGRPERKGGNSIP